MRLSLHLRSPPHLSSTFAESPSIQCKTSHKHSNAHRLDPNRNSHRALVFTSLPRSATPKTLATHMSIPKNVAVRHAASGLQSSAEYLSKVESAPSPVWRPSTTMSGFVRPRL